MSAFFIELLESVQQMDEIVKGEREPSREFHVACMNGSFRVYLINTTLNRLNQVKQPPIIHCYNKTT